MPGNVWSFTHSQVGMPAHMRFLSALLMGLADVYQLES
jgi:hypothetical protein